MKRSRAISAHVAGVLLLAAACAAADDLLDVQGRAVLVGPQTQILVDDQLLAPGAAVPTKPGMRVEVNYASGSVSRAPAAAPAAAAAATVVFSYVVRGPVTSLAPLRVLGQEVGVNANTKSTGLPGGSFANLQIGDNVDVSGYVDTNNSLVASFVEFLPVPSPRWLLSGYVSAAAPAMLALGPQQVDLAGVTPIACGVALAPGQFVEIRASANAPFGEASVLHNVQSLRCTAPVPIGSPGALGALNGVVGEALAPGSFQFGPYVVSYDAATVFRYGSSGDLVPGAAIEVDGTFGNNLQFAAAAIQFAAPMIRLEGPVTPAGVTSGPEGTVSLLGNTVTRSAQLRDQDGIYAGGIAQDRQVEVRGYQDRNGDLFATRARLRGAPDLADVRIGGPVAAIARPLLDVLGNTLDSTGATFEDPAATPISADVFFALAAPGATVEQTGSYDVSSRTLTGGVVALIVPLDPAPPVPPIAAPALIVGTLLGTDRVFAAGFE